MISTDTRHCIQMQCLVEGLGYIEDMSASA